MPPDVNSEDFEFFKTVLMLGRQPTVEDLARQKSLRLGHPSFIDDEVPRLAALTAVETICFPDRITDKGLARLPILPRLRVIDLTGCKIGDSSLEFVAGQPALERLVLHGTSITDAGLAHLAGHQKLKYLDLMSTQISDAGLVHLKEIPTLEVLKLPGRRITDLGVEHLAALTRLKQLDLGSAGITSDGLVHLTGLANLTDELKPCRSFDHGCRASSCRQDLQPSHALPRLDPDHGSGARSPHESQEARDTLAKPNLDRRRGPGDSLGNDTAQEPRRRRHRHHRRRTGPFEEADPPGRNRVPCEGIDETGSPRTKRAFPQWDEDVDFD